MNSNSTKPKEIRRFGLIALVFFGVLAGLGIWRQKIAPTVIFGLLSLLGAGFLILPKQLEPVYEAWQKVAHAIGKVLTVLMLTVAYYLVITPFGLVRRLLRRSFIDLKIDKNATTYWVTRPEGAQTSERFFKRY